MELMQNYRVCRKAVLAGAGFSTPEYEKYYFTEPRPIYSAQPGTFPSFYPVLTLQSLHGAGVCYDENDERKDEEEQERDYGVDLDGAGPREYMH